MPILDFFTHDPTMAQGGGGQNLARNEADSYSLTEQAEFGLGIGRGDAPFLSDEPRINLSPLREDALSMEESFSRGWGIVLSRDDSLSLAESIIKQFGLVSEEIFSLADQADTTLNGLLSLQDTIVLADLIFKTAGVAPQDVFSLADNIAREVGLSFGDLSTLIGVIQKMLDGAPFETVGMSDEFSFVLTEGEVVVIGLPYFKGWAVLPRPRLKRRKWRKRPFGDNLDAQWRRARKIWARSLPS